MNAYRKTNEEWEDVCIPADQVRLEGTLDFPRGCSRIVVFAHGKGSSRFSPRNQFVAQGLVARGIGTLLLDLLTDQEDQIYKTRFDIDLLATRLAYATERLNTRRDLSTASIGLFGASTGAAAALETAASAGGESELSFPEAAAPICPRGICTWSTAPRC